jgi:short-subunit dehydrogenase
MDYSSKTTVWITGASSGIGEALALRYAQLGTSVILSSRNREKLTAVADKCRNLAAAKGSDAEFFVVPVDMSSEVLITEAWETVKSLNRNVDILINNAGISQRALTRDASIEIDKKVMTLNYFGPVFLTKLVLPHMLENENGHIVAISSIVGKFGFPLRSAYSASKHALKGFFESLDAEEYRNNIRVTLVYPGFITTNISVNAVTADGTASGEMDNNQKGGMSPEACAKKIVRGIEKGKHEILVGKKELLLVHIRRFLPALYYKMARKVSPT